MKKIELTGAAYFRGARVAPAGTWNRGEIADFAMRQRQLLNEMNDRKQALVLMKIQNSQFRLMCTCHKTSLSLLSYISQTARFELSLLNIKINDIPSHPQPHAPSCKLHFSSNLLASISNLNIFIKNLHCSLASFVLSWYQQAIALLSSFSLINSRSLVFLAVVRACLRLSAAMSKREFLD